MTTAARVVYRMLSASIAEIERSQSRTLYWAEGERYQLRTWSDGYRIFDRGELIVTLHGPQSELAAKILRLLQDEASRDHAQSTSAPTLRAGQQLHSQT